HLSCCPLLLCVTGCPLVFLLSSAGPPRALHSFPTRRSSDLPGVGQLAGHAGRSGSSRGHPSPPPTPTTGKLTVIRHDLAHMPRSCRMTVDFATTSSRWTSWPASASSSPDPWPASPRSAHRHAQRSASPPG